MPTVYEDNLVNLFLQNLGDPQGFADAQVKAAGGYKLPSVQVEDITPRTESRRIAPGVSAVAAPKPARPVKANPTQALLQQVGSNTSPVTSFEITEPGGRKISVQGASPAELQPPQARVPEITADTTRRAEPTAPQAQGGFNIGEALRNFTDFLGSPRGQILAGQISQALDPTGFGGRLGQVTEGLGRSRAFGQARQGDQKALSLLTPQEQLAIQNQQLAERQADTQARLAESQIAYDEARIANLPTVEEEFTQQENLVKLKQQPKEFNKELWKFDSGNETIAGFYDESGKFRIIGRSKKDSTSKDDLTGNQQWLNAFRIDKAMRSRIAQGLLGEFGQQAGIARDTEGHYYLATPTEAIQKEYIRRTEEALNYEQGLGRIPYEFQGHKFDPELFKIQQGQPGQATAVPNDPEDIRKYIKK